MIMGNGDDSRASEHSEYLVKCILGEHQLSQGWTKFFITIQGGLLAGFAFNMDASHTTSNKWLVLMAFMIMPAFGVISALVLSDVVVRHFQWQAWQIKASNAIPGNRGRVFPDDGQPTTGAVISDEPSQEQPWQAPGRSHLRR
jgi:hypothetical protein